MKKDRNCSYMYVCKKVLTMLVLHADSSFSHTLCIYLIAAMTTLANDVYTGRATMLRIYCMDRGARCRVALNVWVHMWRMANQGQL